MTQRAFGRVVSDRQSPVGRVAAQCDPWIACLRNRLGPSTFGKDRWRELPEGGIDAVPNGISLPPTQLAAGFCRPLTPSIFKVVSRLDPFQQPVRFSRIVGTRIKELAPRMGPARNLGHVVSRRQADRVVTAVRIRVKIAAKPLPERLRAMATSAHRAVSYRIRMPAVSGGGPASSRATSGLAAGEHFDRRVIRPQDGRRKDQLSWQAGKWFPQIGSGRHPVAHGAPGQVQPVPHSIGRPPSAFLLPDRSAASVASW